MKEGMEQRAEDKLNWEVGSGNVEIEAWRIEQRAQASLAVD